MHNPDIFHTYSGSSYLPDPPVTRKTRVQFPAAEFCRLAFVLKCSFLDPEPLSLNQTSKKQGLDPKPRSNAAIKSTHRRASQSFWQLSFAFASNTQLVIVGPQPSAASVV